MQQKVLIIGAGPAGLCLSLALAQRGMQVELFDRQPPEALAEPAFDGREVALAHASMRLLRELGVWQHVPADAPAMLTRAKVMDGANEGFEVSAASLRAAHLGAFVSNHHIRAAAWKAVAEVEDIHVH
ncbi:MAG: FAD-dependent monooxygenase, partial [Xanthomonadales bacterium]|nr:FAD-dependent monooxygenase [Xanthomonadales bacterium]